ncbi:MAG: hypothetical protein M5U28_50330 [Sandaracinaceae bacterium]|nr:hypothetical protein [Sandaracinaceae bacterium]
MKSRCVLVSSRSAVARPMRVGSAPVGDAVLALGGPQQLHVDGQRDPRHREDHPRQLLGHRRLEVARARA